MILLKLLFSMLAFFALVVFTFAGLLAIASGLGNVFHNLLFIFVAAVAVYALYCWNINEFR